MRRVLFPALAAIVLLGVAALQAKDGKVVKKLGDADNGRTVKIAVDEPFAVALESNRTTGYGWTLQKIDGGAVVQKGKPEYVQKKHRKNMVGVGGTEIFHFEVKKAATTKIELVYVRAWEKDKPPVKSFSVTIDSEK